MKARFAGHSRTGLFLFLAVYAGVLVALLPVLSLWLDEIMDLMVVRSAGMRELLAGVAVNSGNAPLNYIVQFWTVHVLGFSPFTGRLPEAIFSLGVLRRHLCAGTTVGFALAAAGGGCVRAVSPAIPLCARSAAVFAGAVLEHLVDGCVLPLARSAAFAGARGAVYVERRRRNLRASVHAVRRGRASCLGCVERCCCLSGWQLRLQAWPSSPGIFTPWEIGARTRWWRGRTKR